MCAQQLKPSARGRIAAFGKILWYSCATILVLSLPTFSYLMPHLKVPLHKKPFAFLAPTEHDAAGSEYEYQMLTGRGGTRDEEPEGPGRRFVSSQSGFGNSRSVGPGGITTISGVVRGQEGGPGAAALNSAPGRGSGPANMAGGVDLSLSRELSLMEDDYQNTMSSLYSGVGFAGGFGSANPFSEALKDSESDGGNNSTKNDNGSQGDSGDSSTGDGGDGQGGDGQGSDGGDSGGGDSPPPNSEPTAPSYSFLVLSEPGTLGPGFVSRAYSDGSGSLILENGATVEIFSGVVGFSRVFFVASEGELFSFDFLNGDGLADVVVASSWSLGTHLQVLYHQGEGWSLEAEASRAFTSIIALAAFDIDGDSVKEIMACFEGERQLTVFEVVGSELDYRRDLVLPFDPAIIVDTYDPVLKTAYLQVYDATLKRSIAFSTRFPGVYSYSKPPTFEGVDVVELEPPVPGGEKFGLLKYRDRLVVTTQVGATHSFLTSLTRNPEVPLTVIGDYSASGNREVIVLP